MHATETTYAPAAREFSDGTCNDEVFEPLTRETNWMKVFGRLNGVYPRAAFHRTVKATY